MKKLITRTALAAAAFALALAFALMVALGGPPSAAAQSATPTTPTPSPTPVPRGTDGDGDGLIEITTAAQLDVMRYDLDGNGVVDLDAQGVVDPNHPIKVIKYQTHFNTSNIGCAPDAGASPNAGAAATPKKPQCEGYELTADIDLSGIDYSNWLPIDGWQTEFDGNGYAVSNMTTTGAGLFGSIGESGTVEEVRLTNATVRFVISGDRMPFRHVGVLAGRNDGAIHNSRAEGSLALTGVPTNVHYAHVGGLVGKNYGTINTSWAGVDIAVTGAGARAGGFVGDNRGTITASFASGDVTVEIPSTYADAQKYNRVGGFVGVNAGLRLSEGGGGGIIRDSIAVGAVRVDGSQGSPFGPVCFRGAQFINVAHDPSGCEPRK